MFFIDINSLKLNRKPIKGLMSLLPFSYEKTEAQKLGYLSNLAQWESGRIEIQAQAIQLQSLNTGPGCCLLLWGESN